MTGKQQTNIPYNKPYLAGKELYYIHQAHKRLQLAGDGFYTKKCQEWIEKTIQCNKSLLTHSATAAIEMMAILAQIEPGDEIIMPNYTFVSTANAFVLRGGIPVFIDIRPDTLNINEHLIEQAITKKTKAITVVHYAGVGCNMDFILKLAKEYQLMVLEDAAQAFLAKYKGKYLGTFGEMAAFSFHETKNIISGEGGAIVINRQNLIDRAQIIREKGTNRTKFFEGKIDKYTWIDIGSSYLPGEIIASFLMAQLERAKNITSKRISLWQRYHKLLAELEEKNGIRRPIIPSEVEHNAHLYYILTKTSFEKSALINFLSQKGICAVTHYTPLDSSPGGKKYSRAVGKMEETNRVAQTIIRLPLYYDLKQTEQEKIVQAIYDFYNQGKI